MVKTRKSRSRIPKIIHQTAPTDKSKWHADWEKYSQSWKKYFHDYKYMLWNDEDIDKFMKEKYPKYYSLFKSYSKQIQRVDIWRYFVLDYYGGIYVDMDIECYGNFKEYLLSSKVNIAQSPWNHEAIQNSFMASKPKHPFWKTVFEELLKRGDNSEYKTSDPDNRHILATTGPIFLLHCISFILFILYIIYI